MKYSTSERSILSRADLLAESIETAIEACYAKFFQLHFSNDELPFKFLSNYVRDKRSGSCQLYQQIRMADVPSESVSTDARGFGDSSAVPLVTFLLPKQKKQSKLNSAQKPLPKEKNVISNNTQKNASESVTSGTLRELESRKGSLKRKLMDLEKEDESVPTSRNSNSNSSSSSSSDSSSSGSSSDSDDVIFIDKVPPKEGNSLNLIHHISETRRCLQSLITNPFFETIDTSCSYSPILGIFQVELIVNQRYTFEGQSNRGFDAAFENAIEICVKFMDHLRLTGSEKSVPEQQTADGKLLAVLIEQHTGLSMEDLDIRVHCSCSESPVAEWKAEMTYSNQKFQTSSFSQPSTAGIHLVSQFLMDELGFQVYDCYKLSEK